MRFFADFHIHSHFSLATSKLLTPVYLDYWAKIKGITVLGTGDFTHPGWTQELKNYIEPAEQGLFKLKDEFIIQDNPLNNRPVRFMLTAEISNIYKKDGKVRKVHNVVLAPDFQTVEKVQKQLADRKFNITSDGRPILGLDSADLLDMLLNIDERIVFIPAHIWTPWFSALGSKSGFDTIEQAFGSLTKHIFALETGLSSDQPLNWLCSFLDNFTLISNSDAHSPEKLGRNANVFDTALSYDAIIQALKKPEDGFAGTIDLYPQEGKYHFDGHRKCGVSFNPAETMEHGGICPVCGKKLTLGVAHRIAQLADRDTPDLRPVKHDFKYVIPLKEILSEIMGISPSSKKIDAQYHKLIRSLGSELDILLNLPTDEIRKHGGEFLQTAIDRMRNDKVFITEGFDGEYGKIKLFAPGEIKSYGAKKSIFDVSGQITENDIPKRPLLNFDVAKFRKLKQNFIQSIENKLVTQTFNPEQKKAIEFDNGNVLVLAGPGTGKTYVLVKRIEHLINKDVDATKILAVTFSRQASIEILERIAKNIGAENANELTVKTFHSLGFDILKQHADFIIIGDKDKKSILEALNVPKNSINKTINRISKAKNTLIIPDDLKNIFDAYNNYLINNDLCDFDDLVYRVVSQNTEIPAQWQFEHILVDEIQDINNAQYAFMKKLTAGNTHLFAIGDPNQAIYGFRGANPELIKTLQQEYKAETVSLSKSYRCTDNIIEASADVVKAPEVLSGIDKGIKIKISEFPTYKSEAEFIARTIEDMIGGLRFFSIDSNVTKGSENQEIKSLSDFAVLVRTKDLFEPISKALNDHAIPHQIIGTKFFAAETPFYEITTVLKAILYPDNKFLQQRKKDIVGDFELSKNQNVTDLISALWNKFFAEKYEHLQDFYEKYLNLAKDKTLFDFVSYVETLQGQDDYNPDIEAVSVMTMHASKGLEFKCVFVAGLENGIVPLTIHQKNTDLEEERRLLYVAMTRSKKYLYLSSAKTRKIANSTRNMHPSIFIDDIKKQLLQKIKTQYKTKNKGTQLNLFD